MEFRVSEQSSNFKMDGRRLLPFSLLHQREALWSEEQNS